MTISTRRAAAEDIDWILGQLKNFDRFFGAGKALFQDEGYARGTLAGWIQSHFVMIAESPSRGRMGFIAGVMIPHFFNPKIRVLAEMFWWVSEEHRRTRAGAMLLSDFTAHGKANADWITFALEEHSPIEDRSLVKRGFKLKERSFLMEVPCPH